MVTPNVEGFGVVRPLLQSLQVVKRACVERMQYLSTCTSSIVYTITQSWPLLVTAN
jgi:hypothetical protein